MNTSVPADIDVVANVDVSGHGRVARDDEVIADYAVVRDVRIGEQGVVVTEDGPFALLGAEVYADVFAEGVTGADLEAGLARAGFQVLRAAANKGIRKNFTLWAELRVALDRGVVM